MEGSAGFCGPRMLLGSLCAEDVKSPWLGLHLLPSAPACTHHGLHGTSGASMAKDLYRTLGNGRDWGVNTSWRGEGWLEGAGEGGWLLQPRWRLVYGL